ncbi:MAG: hypothetical protein NZM11_07975 [Anaerolineales bacterium]|nr:hypothetical protein [Anaerolineales bacterium]
MHEQIAAQIRTHLQAQQELEWQFQLLETVPGIGGYHRRSAGH